MFHKKISVQSRQVIIVYREFSTVIFIVLIQAHIKSFKQHYFSPFFHIEVKNLKLFWESQRL